MAAHDGDIQITFRGVRGSYPVPGSKTLLYGGNTSCQEIRAGGRLLIFDAGTGIINLGHEIPDGEQTMALFVTHNHHDHTAGILYFNPAYRKGTTVYMYGPQEGPGGLLEALVELSGPVVHPVELANMGMTYYCQTLGTGSVVAWSPEAAGPRLLTPSETPTDQDVVVRALKNPRHPTTGVLNLRLEYKGKSYVYATDVEGDEETGDPGLADFARGADLLAHDGQYCSGEYFASRKGWGHSTVAMALKTACMAKAKRLAIIHHEPQYDDQQLAVMEYEAHRDHPFLFFAKEDQVITI